MGEQVDLAPKGRVEQPRRNLVTGLLGGKDKGGIEGFECALGHPVQAWGRKLNELFEIGR